MRPGRRLRLGDACVSREAVVGLNELQRWILSFNEHAFDAAGLFILNAGATALAGGTIDVTLHDAMHTNASALFKSSLQCSFFSFGSFAELSALQLALAWATCGPSC